MLSFTEVIAHQTLLLKEREAVSDQKAMPVLCVWALSRRTISLDPLASSCLSRVTCRTYSSGHVSSTSRGL